MFSKVRRRKPRNDLKKTLLNTPSQQFSRGASVAALLFTVLALFAIITTIIIVITNQTAVVQSQIFSVQMYNVITLNTYLTLDVEITKYPTYVKTCVLPFEFAFPNNEPKSILKSNTDFLPSDYSPLNSKYETIEVNNFFKINFFRDGTIRMTASDFTPLFLQNYQLQRKRCLVYTPLNSNVAAPTNVKITSCLSDAFTTDINILNGYNEYFGLSTFDGHAFIASTENCIALPNQTFLTVFRKYDIGNMSLISGPIVLNNVLNPNSEAAILNNVLNDTRANQNEPAICVNNNVVITYFRDNLVNSTWGSVSAPVSFNNGATWNTQATPYIDGKVPPFNVGQTNCSITQTGGCFDLVPMAGSDQRCLILDSGEIWLANLYNEGTKRNAIVLRSNTNGVTYDLPPIVFNVSGESYDYPVLSQSKNGVYLMIKSNSFAGLYNELFFYSSNPVKIYSSFDRDYANTFYNLYSDTTSDILYVVQQSELPFQLPNLQHFINMKKCYPLASGAELKCGAFKTIAITDWSPELIPPQALRKPIPSLNIQKDTEGTLYVSYLEHVQQPINNDVRFMNNPDTNIQMIFSKDDGNTWSAPQLINDAGGIHFNVQMKYDSKTHSMVFVWLDTRNDTTGFKRETSQYLSVYKL